MVGDGQRQENSAPVAPVELVAPVAPVSTPAFPARENRLPTEFDEGRTTLTPHGNSRETSLPSFAPLSTPNFQWGCQPGHEFSRSIRAAYQETVHWRRNVFLVPSGKVGKDFVRELTALFTAYSQAAALESVALDSVMVVCTLLLQKPHVGSKCRDHVEVLDRRLKLWREGNLDELLREGRTIQHHLTHRRTRSELSNGDDNNGYTARTFANLVFQGKIHSALRFLSDNQGGSVLSLDEQASTDNNVTVREVLRQKHPAPRDEHAEALLPAMEKQDIHPGLFDRLTGASIRSAALKTTGSAGPSGVDAAGWRRLCCSFHKESNDLCAAIAAFAWRISTNFVDPDGLSAFVACRLLPLDKNPGVRPIGVCEVLRRIVGKAVMAVVKQDVLKAAGAHQLCAGQNAGCEAAVHAMKRVFQNDETDAILLVDASNAFNNINRKVALLNILQLCPAIAVILVNCYRNFSQLFVGGEIILSQEGTTQGDPLAMAFFGLASVPLIQAVATDGIIQTWFADDAASGGKLIHLFSWWTALNRLGPMFGYLPNAVKTFLVVKPEKIQEAEDIFKETGVNICTAGQRYLGGAIGSKKFVTEFIAAKVTEWVAQLDRLAKFAQSQPHAALFGLNKWPYWTMAILDLPDGTNRTFTLSAAGRCDPPENHSSSDKPACARQQHTPPALFACPPWRPGYRQPSRHCS